MTAQAPKHRFVILDSLRGVCAVMVALFHFQANSHIAHTLIVRNSWLFVDFFFVLSGFVITASYRDRLTSGQVPAGRFMWRRLARVYPLHLVMLTLFVLAEVAKEVLFPAGVMQSYPPFTATRAPWLLPENLFLLQALNLSGVASWNVPSWSISAEVWTYLLFALCMVAGRAGRGLFWGLTLIVAPGLVIAWYGGSLALEAQGGFLRCLFGFGMGALGWSVWQRLGGLPRLAGWVEVPLLALVVAFVIWAPMLGLTFFGPLLFGAAVLCFAAERGPVSALLGGRVFVWLGVLSYSIYMTQTFVHARMKNVALLVEHRFHLPLFSPDGVQMFGTTEWLGDLFVLACFGVTLAVSVLTWRFVEIPGQRLARRPAPDAVGQR